MSTETSSTAPIEEGHTVTASDYQVLLEEQRAENERLRAIITASRIAPVADHPQKDAKPAISAARLTATLGQTQINRMTRAEKLSALGLEPSSVDEAFLRQCFGRGNDGSAASELHKTSPLRYRQLKEASLLLGIFAN